MNGPLEIATLPRFVFIRGSLRRRIGSILNSNSITSLFFHILMISVSSWEGKTPYQEKFGNEPDHCKVPMLNLKTRAVKILDFE